LPIGVKCLRVAVWGAVAVAVAAALSACNAVWLDQRKDEPQNAVDVIRSADLQPRAPQLVREPDPGSKSNQARSYFGVSPAPDPPPGVTKEMGDDGKDGFTLNFENAPVTNVAKVVLGDILGVGYMIDPRAQGTISLSSGRPIAKKDMLFVLESALRANNLALLHDKADYRIVPIGEGALGGVDRADRDGGVEPGFGTTVIPLRYVSGATLAKLLEGFAVKPGVLRTDPTGQLLLAQGSGSDRQAVIDTVRNFDVDWMRGQSVGIYPIHNSTPEPVIAELEKIMDSGETGMNHNLVKLQSIARQNAVLAVTARPDLLRTAAMWIARLDSSSLSSVGVKVYHVRYGDAKELAQLLNQMFLGGNGSSAGNEIAPTSGSKTLSALDRLSANPSSSGAAGSRGAPGAAMAASAMPTTGAAAAEGANANAATASATLSLTGGATGGGALPGVRITADTKNNTILIYADADNYRIIENALNQMDRPQAQVAIDVTIAEVTLNDNLSYGVQFFLSHKFGSVINSAGGEPISPTLPGFNVIVGSQTTPHAIINALHSLTDVKILSNPSLVVVDNESASLEVGDQVPVSTGAATVLSSNNTVVNTIDYVNTGIILHVTPHVNSNGNVLLDIEQEISSAPPSTGNSVNLTPTISQRKVKSEISVANSQTVLLAGLVSDTQNNSRSGVPVLDQIPYLGAAFSTSGKSTQRTELIIFIRPQIIRDSVDASRVAEELRSKMRGGTIGAVNLPNALNIGVRPGAQ